MNTNQVDSAVYRLIDASFNRSSEAIRVIEDYLRFVADDPHLCAMAKRLRHQLHDNLQAVQQRVPALREQLLLQRDSIGDVGRDNFAQIEPSRENLRDLLVANLKRLQQGLRTLEESSKLVDSEWATANERLRFEAYQLEKLSSRLDRHAWSFCDAWLCVLIDATDSLPQFETKVSNLVEAKVSMLQLRDKNLSDRDLLKRGHVLRSLTLGTCTRWMFNDRVDLAKLSNADGVHLGQDDVSVADARRLLGPEFRIGVSTHSLEQALQASMDGADYIGVGPVFRSATKHFDQFVGLELLETVATSIDIPAFAIGGISTENAQSVFATGIHGVAVSSAFANPLEATQIFAQFFEARRLGRHGIAQT
ncbi:MAG TPA: thiamine phosphate synthase [Pirellulaceae bacterium]|nr:thiamine phosphate synthase [Pirellulaceae bacterium]HMO93701.1 thiamine phosphate synthase [Pirellulaceae bacterium]HMP70963.1 thiamine phosphate synthase [Pirellulaceae bacterium]